ncbi:hypothetical protein GCM10010530_07470 [Kribbella aluminosa]
MHCYFKEHFMMTAKERSAVLALFTGFAAQQGIELGCIFRDTVETGAAGLDALRVALRVDDVRLVAVPAFPHLDVLGDHRGVVREFAAAGMTVVAADSCFSHGPTRSIGCDPSSQNRPFPWSPGAVRTSSGHRTGTPSQSGERVHSKCAVSCSPFHPEKPMRVSRSASLPSVAPAWGQRELGSIP